MSRENFLVRLTDADNEPVHVMIHNITVVETRPDGMSLIFVPGKKDPVLVKESVEEIIKKASAYGVLRSV